MKALNGYRSFIFSIFSILLVLCFSGLANAEDFCVSTAQELTNALATAVGNNEDDLIQIVQGTYYGNFIFGSTELHDFTIEGGHNSDCSERTVDPVNTVLDAGGSGPVLVFSAPDVLADFAMDGLTLQNGNVTIQGGGLYVVTNGAATLTNNIIRDNFAQNSGGGIYFNTSGTVTLTNNTINNNDTWQSGGGGYFSSHGTLTLTNNTINNNNANHWWGGGGYFSSHGTVTLTNNTINNNNANYGGGISLRSYDGTVTLTNNTINNNNSTFTGGIYFESYHGTLTLTNNTINNNNANYWGGGVGLYLNYDDDISNIYNNIIWNNSAGGAGAEGADLYINNDENNNYIPSAVYLFNNDFDQSADGTYIQRPFTIDPSNLDNVDPLFVDPANDNYHLTANSQCINAGDNNAPEIPDTDKDGNPRIMYGTVDMGAYEYQDIPPSLTVSSPNGGEELTAGTTHEITWTSGGDIENVKIEYSVNNGTDWIEIVDSTINDSSYNWEVPNNPSEQCLLRISDVDSGLSDESDAVFSILPLWYVDRDIAVSGNGTSWAEAFKSIQEAIDAADDGDAIWVKLGTYFITSTIDVEKSVFIYGGFDGTETNKSERNWRTNITTVDGQNTESCFHFSADATLDGFTIAHGHTNWGGGGMYIESSSPVVINCKFFENTANINGGGAIHSYNASPIITNSLFLENDGGSNGGGAIFNWDCPAVVVTNCTFSGNEGGSSGGGAIYNYNSLTVVTNCILWGDSAYLGSEVYNEGGTLTISHCDLSGGMVGVVNAGGGTINDDGTNIELDPLFAATYHLQAGSPCINAGDNAALPPDTTDLDNDGDTTEPIPLDLDGEPRILDDIVEMGAYEYVYQSPGDEPAVDFDGDGITDIAVYRTGTWFILPSSGGSYYAVGFGGDPNDVSVPGDYDGDGMTDIAVYRTGTWFIPCLSGCCTYLFFLIAWVSEEVFDIYGKTGSEVSAGFPTGFPE